MGFIVLGGINGLVFWQMCGPAAGAWFASASRRDVALPKAFWSMLLVGLVAVVPWVVNDLSAAATLKAAYPVSVRLLVVDDQTGQPVTVPVKMESSLLQRRPSRRAVLPQLRWVGSSMAESSAVFEFAGIKGGSGQGGACAPSGSRAEGCGRTHAKAGAHRVACCEAGRNLAQDSCRKQI